MKKIKKISNVFIVFYFAIQLLSSCKKLTEVNAPVNSLNSANVYASDATAIATVTGLYTQISASGTAFTGSVISISLFPGLSSDEFQLYSGQNESQSYFAYYRNALSASVSQGSGSEYWVTFYSYIFICNAAIEGLNSSTTLTPAVKQQLLGETYFMRAFFYFYLTNLYGDVPLAITSNYVVNSTLPRTSTLQVYQQMIADLQIAQKLLSGDYLSGTLLATTSERVRPTKWAALALLARADLYYAGLNNSSYYAKADSAATAVISSSSYALAPLTGPNGVFIRNSTEAIWQLQPINSSGITNTWDASAFIIPSTGPLSGTQVGVYLSTYLLNSFEPGDLRLTNWIGSTNFLGATYYFPFKYQVSTSGAPVTEYQMLLRLGEQYLIRAEAKAQEGDITASQADLNAIRNRAGLPNTSSSTQSTLLASILHERQVELFTELGQRWLDLKRTGNANAVMGAGGVCASKGGSWNANWQLYPLPFSDLQNDKYLKQNSGY